jgi:ankyrin repeat protein
MKLNTFSLIFIVFFFSLTSIAQEKLDVFEVARRGTVENAKAILKSNPNAFNIVNEDGYSPLILACYKGNNEMTKFLIKNGSDVNFKSAMGSALMAATVKGNIEIAKLLLENEANPDITDSNGMTALLYAVNFKNYELVKLLVKFKSNIEAKDNRGYNALDYAILANDDKLIEILKTN